MTVSEQQNEQSAIAILMNGQDRDAFEARLMYLAWRWYRIPSDVAEDVLQSALLTYLEVRDRYEDEKEHPVIMVGIFRNKCREYIAQSTRNAKGMRTLQEAAQGDSGQLSSVRPEGTPEDGVLHRLVEQEDGNIILRALSELRPKAREMLRLIAEEGVTRQELIERYGLNKNTLDSRLHAYRKELRNLLRRKGVAI